jgi:hypothetical protein
MKGHSAEVNSASVESTRERSGSDAATSPTRGEAAPPTVTHSIGTPQSAAKDPRAARVASFQCSQLVRPARHSSSAAWSAFHAGVGGNP